MSAYVKNEWGKVKYMTDYEWSSNISHETKLQYKQGKNGGKSETKKKKDKKLTRILEIIDKNHPAFGQHGLFAVKKIQAKSWICDYIGFIENKKNESQTSDYILHFIDDLSIDAEYKGNEARFINDYRGIAQRPNAQFQTYWHDHGLRMGVFAMSQPIRANCEIIVSYGKGFWKARKKC